MNCQELAARIQRLQPAATERDVARLCLLLSNFAEDLEALTDDERLNAAWQQAALRLQLATDQHAAVMQELEQLASSDPEKFTPDQVWILVRAIKVQAQVLAMYVGQAPIDV
ncbi:MAG TPA: hypothetical protein VMV10_11650 [Pirellulales bacterium]|nr:hypothetical protein [Pirellulales bacterium]